MLSFPVYIYRLGLFQTTERNRDLVKRENHRVTQVHFLVFMKKVDIGEKIDLSNLSVSLLLNRKVFILVLGFMDLHILFRIILSSFRAPFSRFVKKDVLITVE